MSLAVLYYYTVYYITGVLSLMHIGQYDDIHQDRKRFYNTVDTVVSTHLLCLVELVQCKNYCKLFSRSPSWQYKTHMKYLHRYYHI